MDTYGRMMHSSKSIYCLMRTVFNSHHGIGSGENKRPAAGRRQWPNESVAEKKVANKLGSACARIAVRPGS